MGFLITWRPLRCGSGGGSPSGVPIPDCVSSLASQGGGGGAVLLSGPRAKQRGRLALCPSVLCCYAVPMAMSALCLLPVAWLGSQVLPIPAASLSLP